METDYKFACPGCAGVIAIEHEHFFALQVEAFNCPHCGAPIRLKISAELQAAPVGSADGGSVLRLRDSAKHSTVVSQPPVSDVVEERTSSTATGLDDEHSTVPCPHCGVQIGRRDRYCVTCGNKVPGK